MKLTKILLMTILAAVTLSLSACANKREAVAPSYDNSTPMTQGYSK